MLKWVQIENRPDNNRNVYYIANNPKKLIITMDNDGDNIVCKLPDGSIKNLKLSHQMHDASYPDSSGIEIVGNTKKWFVGDDKVKYPLEEIEVSKDDISKYLKSE